MQQPVPKIFGFEGRPKPDEVGSTIILFLDLFDRYGEGDFGEACAIRVPWLTRCSLEKIQIRRNAGTGLPKK
jgi:hypothetical protein